MLTLSPKLKTALEQTEALAPIRGDASQIDRCQGEFLANLALSRQARHIVEIGTSYGYSGLWWCAALEKTNGHLHTIDLSEKKYSAAIDTFASADVERRVTPHLGDAQTILKTLSGPIDIAFIDADKPSTRNYFDLVWDRIPVGGSVVTDNTLSHAQEMAPFLQYARSLQYASSIHLPFSKGMEWTVKLS